MLSGSNGHRKGPPASVSWLIEENKSFIVAQAPYVNTIKSLSSVLNVTFVYDYNVYFLLWDHNSACFLLLKYILPPPPCNPFPAPHPFLNLLPEQENSLALMQNNIMFLF